jgi:hypothetical protein
MAFILQRLSSVVDAGVVVIAAGGASALDAVHDG